MVTMECKKCALDIHLAIINQSKGKLTVCSDSNLSSDPPENSRLQRGTEGFLFW